jgi:hypothetical protein
VNQHDPDSLRLLTRERHEQRRREGDNERLARDIRGTTPRRRRRPLSVGFTLATRRPMQPPRLEA